jgi:hypothetical protein
LAYVIRAGQVLGKIRPIARLHRFVDNISSQLVDLLAGSGVCSFPFSCARAQARGDHPADHGRVARQVDDLQLATQRRQASGSTSQTFWISWRRVLEASHDSPTRPARLGRPGALPRVDRLAAASGVSFALRGRASTTSRTWSVSHNDGNRPILNTLYSKTVTAEYSA